MPLTEGRLKGVQGVCFDAAWVLFYRCLCVCVFGGFVFRGGCIVVWRCCGVIVLWLNCWSCLFGSMLYLIVFGSPWSLVLLVSGAFGLWG